MGRFKFSLCKLCSSDFSITHGGFNDIKRHVEGLNHQRRLKQSTLLLFLENQVWLMPRK